MRHVDDGKTTHANPDAANDEIPIVGRATMQDFCGHPGEDTPNIAIESREADYAAHRLGFTSCLSVRLLSQRRHLIARA
jgi:hypothetical protein